MNIEYTITADFGFITLTNPPYNELNDPVFADPRQLREFLNQEFLKGIIIRGKGRNFCAGADRNKLSSQLTNPDKLMEMLDIGKELLNLIYFAPVPVVAVVKGSCLGAGLEIALACHFRFVSANAVLGFPESSLNLQPGLGGSVSTKGRLHKQSQIDLLISGKMINGAEAHQLGLTDYVFPTKQVETEAVNFLSGLTEKRSPYIIHSIMHAINNSEILSRENALKQETNLFIKLARKINV